MSWFNDRLRHTLSAHGIKTKAPVVMMGDYEREVIKDLKSVIEESNIDCDVILSTISQFGIVHLGFEDGSGADIDDLRVLRDTMEEYAEEHDMKVKYMLHNGRVGYTIY